MRQPLKDPSTSVGIGILISSSCINIRVAKVVEFQEKLHNCYKKITVSSCAVDSRLKAFLDLLATPFLG